MTARRLARQRGFTLLECMVATILTSALALSLARAVLDNLHATARSDSRANLTTHALNILSDLREATAYDSDALKRIAGRTTAATFPVEYGNGDSTLTATINVAPGSGSGPLWASVTVTDATGVSVTERQSLSVEAPAPGSVIDQTTPAPAPAQGD